MRVVHRRPSRLHAAVRSRARRGARPAGASTCGCSRPASATARCRAADGYTVDDSLYRALDAASGHGTAASPPRRSSTRSRSPGSGSPTAISLHLQWVAAPEADAWLLHTREPLVFTAHDLLPRRTARHTRTWKRLFRPLRPGRHPQRARPPHARGVRRPEREAARHPPSRLPQRSGPGRRRPHRARARRDPAVQGASRRRRGRARRSRRAAPRRGRSPDPARRAPRGSGRSRRVAARVPRRGGDRARARRRDRRGLPLPGGARPVRRAPAGDRSRRAGRRLRRRRPGRDRRRVRRRPRRPARGRRGPEAGRCASCWTIADALAEARAGAARARAALTWDSAAAEHLALYEELA